MIKRAVSILLLCSPLLFIYSPKAAAQSQFGSRNNNSSNSTTSSNITNPAQGTGSVGGGSGGTNIFGTACSAGTAKNSAVCQEANNSGNTDPVAGPGGLVQKATTLISAVAGIIAVLILIIGGISFATAGGEPEKAKRARTMITNAIIGLIVIAMAWAIISFVIQHVISS